MARISAILTAAGESSRMGRPKPLLSWHGLPLVEYQMASLVEADVAEVVVVLGHQQEMVAPHVKGNRVRWVPNPDYLQGKTTSIKTGLRSVASDAEGVLLLAVDQPRPPELIAAVMATHVEGRSLITSPRRQGKGGHPLIFASSLIPELLRITEEGEGIRQVFRAHSAEVNPVEVYDPIVTLDLNSPEEYEEAKAKYGA